MRNWCLQCIECSRTVCNRVILRNISYCIVPVSPVSHFLILLRVEWCQILSDSAIDSKLQSHLQYIVVRTSILSCKSPQLFQFIARNVHPSKRFASFRNTGSNTAGSPLILGRDPLTATRRAWKLNRTTGQPLWTVFAIRPRCEEGPYHRRVRTRARV